MLRYNTKSWWRLIFQIHKGDTFRTLLPNLILVALFSFSVVYFNSAIKPGYLIHTNAIHGLFGFVISLLLVFRTNTAYERWWEGRRLWGTLINTSRNIALKCHAYIDLKDSVRERLAFDIANFAVVLKDHLQGRIETSGSQIRHPPSAAVELLLMDLTNLNRHGSISDVQILTLNNDITLLSDICGACERIKNTPIPFSYHAFIKKFVFAYVFSMPFVFASEFGFWTCLITTFMFYVLASLEILAEEIENPFGDDANDLPLDELSHIIRKNVYEILLIYPKGIENEESGL